MKNLITILTFLCLSLFSIHEIQAQAVNDLSGKVVDQNNKGVDLAMVALQRLVDSTFVKSEFTDVDGTYLITKIPVGNYILQVNLIGYEQYQKSIAIDSTSKQITFPPIVLAPSTNLLNEVTVTSKVPYIERRIDRTVINVDALSSNAGSDVLEVLERAPGISVDNNGSLILKGRSGVAVFINDKPSYLSGSELESYLRSLPAGTVKHIEIMTNPPAKYEASGNSGVINIILKKNKLQGFNGNVSLGFRQGKYRSSNNSLNLHFNKNKVSLYANTSGGFWKSYQDLTINRHYRSEAGEQLSSFSQNSYGLNEGQYLNTKFGIDYFLNDKTTLGLSYKISNNPSERNNDNNANVSDAQDNLTQRVVADNNTDRSFRNNVYNLYLNHKIGSRVLLPHQ